MDDADGKAVLVVEDDETIRRLLVEYLRQRSGLAVDASRDGIEALHQLSTRQYSLVILDLMMPKMSGVDFLESLKAISADPTVGKVRAFPDIIVITAAPSGELPAETLHERFPDLVRAVFRKPLDVMQLVREIEARL